jgi:putative ABC transport system permease protein
VDEVPPTVYAITFRQLSEGISDTSSYSSLAPEVILRIDGTPLPEVLPALEATWDGIQSGLPFEFYMLEQELAAQYAQQANFQEIVRSATTLALIVAAMGLFAMALLVANRRRKEIGIRKVLGSNVWRIVVLLTNDFSKLVLLSNLIAWPVAYFAMNRWLENFAYRIDLTPLIFIGSGLIALCIAWVTVGGTAAKAASQRPVLALRYE